MGKRSLVEMKDTTVQYRIYKPELLTTHHHLMYQTVDQDFWELPFLWPPPARAWPRRRSPARPERDRCSPASRGSSHTPPHPRQRRDR
jgi:hypothetical protein